MPEGNWCVGDLHASRTGPTTISFQTHLISLLYRLNVVYYIAREKSGWVL